MKKEAWHYEFSGADPGGPCSRGESNESPNDPPEPTDNDNDASDADPSASQTETGKACASDGACNPGDDGSGLICVRGECVHGCRTNAQCPGSTLCKSGKCR